MFSHGLVAYQAALIDYATKTSYTYQAALKILEEKPQYNFTILKELTQVPVVHDTDNTVRTKEMSPIDLDQMLFFKVRKLFVGAHYNFIQRIFIPWNWISRKTSKTVRKTMKKMPVAPATLMRPKPKKHHLQYLT